MRERGRMESKGGGAEGGREMRGCQRGRNERSDLDRRNRREK